jgi:hypothetical protein
MDFALDQGAHREFSDAVKQLGEAVALHLISQDDPLVRLSRPLCFGEGTSGPCDKLDVADLAIEVC